MLCCQLTLTVHALPAPINNERYICDFVSNVLSSWSYATYVADRLYCAAAEPDLTVDQGNNTSRLLRYYYFVVVISVIIIIINFHLCFY